MGYREKHNRYHIWYQEHREFHGVVAVGKHQRDNEKHIAANNDIVIKNQQQVKKLCRIQVAAGQNKEIIEKTDGKQKQYDGERPLKLILSVTTEKEKSTTNEQAQGGSRSETKQQLVKITRIHSLQKYKKKTI